MRFGTSLIIPVTKTASISKDAINVIGRKGENNLGTILSNMAKKTLLYLQNHVSPVLFLTVKMGIDNKNKASFKFLQNNKKCGHVFCHADGF